MKSYNSTGTASFSFDGTIIVTTASSGIIPTITVEAGSNANPVGLFNGLTMTPIYLTITNLAAIALSGFPPGVMVSIIATNRIKVEAPTGIKVVGPLPTGGTSFTYTISSTINRNAYATQASFSGTMNVVNTTSGTISQTNTSWGAKADIDGV